MSRLEEFHGAVARHGSVDAAVEHLIPNSTTSVPWRGAGFLKTEMTGDGLKARNAAIQDALRRPAELHDFDPTNLRATQPSVTRSGMKHYLTDDTWQRTGETYADKHNAGNQYPVVYRRARDSEHVLLSGHHRGVTALMKGQPLRGRLVEGP